MNQAAAIANYGEVIEPNTLRIRRLLPGSIDRVWSYLTDSDLRRRWLASGAMEMQVGAPFELVWRNDELMDNPGTRPESSDAEHRMRSEITELDPPRKISFTFGNAGEVTFELEPLADEVLLTLTPRRLPGRNMMLKVAAGWHAHLDVLGARISGREPEPFWDNWTSLKTDYDRRIPA
jgi:uncharacterized protein YndB with AHSA1/START domain